MHKALTALLVLGLCSCAGFPGSDPLQVTVAGVEPMQGEGLELRFAVKLRVQNPNDAAIEYDGVALTLDLNEREFGSGVSSEVGTVPRYGESLLTIPVTVDMFDIARQVQGLMGGGDGQAVTYKVSGKLEGGMFGTRRFKGEGTLEMPQAEGPN
ncbi:MAG TPA: LEA type 2 family protein [Woeseiaceae bacterium]|nr:LEA type 2 family protein [Woeseiaceae bacterium]